jgi:hypothetical protein
MGFIGNGDQENRLNRAMSILGNFKRSRYLLNKYRTPFNSRSAISGWQIVGFGFA